MCLFFDFVFACYYAHITINNWHDFSTLITLIYITRIFLSNIHIFNLTFAVCVTFLFLFTVTKYVKVDNKNASLSKMRIRVKDTSIGRTHFLNIDSANNTSLDGKRSNPLLMPNFCAFIRHFRKLLHYLCVVFEY